jgi:hypothetical protein
MPNTLGLGSWVTWHQERLKPLRGMPGHAKLDYMVGRSRLTL